MYVSTVFDVLSRFCLCEGFPVVAKRTAKDARGNIVGPPKNGTVVMILQLPCTPVQSVLLFIARLHTTRKLLSVRI